MFQIKAVHSKSFRLTPFWIRTNEFTPNGHLILVFNQKECIYNYCRKKHAKLQLLHILLLLTIYNFIRDLYIIIFTVFFYNKVSNIT